MNLALLKADLLRDEGYRATVYKDSEGLDTIGIGFLVDPSRPGAGLSRQECDLILDHRLAVLAGVLDRAMPWWRTMPEPVRRGLANMAYQLGVGGLRKFTKTLALLRAGKFAAAAAEALDSRWAQQTPSRARRVAALLAAGAADTTTKGADHG